MNFMQLKEDGYYGRYFKDEDELLDVTLDPRVRRSGKLDCNLQRVKEFANKLDIINKIEHLTLVDYKTLLRSKFVSLDRKLVSVLNNAKLYTYGQILKLDVSELEKLPNMGRSQMSNLQNDLLYVGLGIKNKSFGELLGKAFKEVDNFFNSTPFNSSFNTVPTLNSKN